MFNKCHIRTQYLQQCIRQNVFKQITEYSYTHAFKPGNLLKAEEQALVGCSGLKRADGTLNC